MDKVRVMRHGRVVEYPAQAPTIFEIGVPGIPGRQGEKGEKGDAMTFEDLTPEQKAELKGDKGDPGDDAQIVPIENAVIDNLF